MLKIALVLPAKIPAYQYGGTERVFCFLAQALRDLGHQVTLVCEPVQDLGFSTIVFPKDQPQNLESLLPSDLDLIHYFYPPAHLPKRPYLVTIQGNGKAGEQFAPNTVFVSQNHAQRHGWSEFVYNGLDLEQYPLTSHRDSKNPLAFLAKASWKVKNLRGALRITRRLSQSLWIMGGRAPWPWNFWPGARSLGMVGQTEKIKHLHQSSALLFPVRWHEPFGIALTEALACGLPVMGTPYGSLPEIVSPDVGLLSLKLEDFVQAWPHVQNIDPQQCRQRVAQLFTHHQMAQNYLEKYQKILNHGQLRSGHPQVPADQHPGALLKGLSY